MKNKVERQSRTFPDWVHIWTSKKIADRIQELESCVAVFHFPRIGQPNHYEAVAFDATCDSLIRDIEEIFREEEQAMKHKEVLVKVDGSHHITVWCEKSVLGIIESVPGVESVYSYSEHNNSVCVDERYNIEDVANAIGKAIASGDATPDDFAVASLRTQLADARERVRQLSGALDQEHELHMKSIEVGSTAQRELEEAQEQIDNLRGNIAMLQDQLRATNACLASANQRCAAIARDRDNLQEKLKSAESPKVDPEILEQVISIFKALDKLSDDAMSVYADAAHLKDKLE